MGKRRESNHAEPCLVDHPPSFPAVPSRGSCKRVASMLLHVFWRPCHFQRGGNEDRKWKLPRPPLIKVGQKRAVLKQVLLLDRLACKFVNLVNSFLRPRCPYYYVHYCCSALVNFKPKMYVCTTSLMIMSVDFFAWPVLKLYFLAA